MNHADFVPHFFKGIVYGDKRYFHSFTNIYVYVYTRVTDVLGVYKLSLYIKLDV